MSQQTALEWLEEELSKYDSSYESIDKIFEQAKQMENEQIRMSFIDGKLYDKYGHLNSTEYYNETYNK